MDRKHRRRIIGPGERVKIPVPGRSLLKLTARGHVPQAHLPPTEDKYGLSWQVVPTVLEKMLAREDHNSAKFNAVMSSMLKMTKLDIAELEKA